MILNFKKYLFFILSAKPQFFQANKKSFVNHIISISIKNLISNLLKNLTNENPTRLNIFFIKIDYI